MSGTKTFVTGPTPGETMPSGDDPKGTSDAISSIDFWNFTGCVLRFALDGGSHDSEAGRSRAAQPFDETEAV
jgi:hypothetical protein